MGISRGAAPSLARGAAVPCAHWLLNLWRGAPWPTNLWRGAPWPTNLWCGAPWTRPLAGRAPRWLALVGAQSDVKVFLVVVAQDFDLDGVARGVGANQRGH